MDQLQLQINDHKNEADKHYFNYLKINDLKKEDGHKNVQIIQEMTVKLEESQAENEKLKKKFMDIQIQQSKNDKLIKNMEAEKLLLETTMAKLRERLFDAERLLEIEKNTHIKTKKSLANEQLTVEKK
jgi:hypothetical protein